MVLHVASLVAVIFARLDRFSPPKYIHWRKEPGCAISDVNRTTSTCITGTM